MATPRLEIQRIKVAQLIDDYHVGRLVVPEFQREYVWTPGRAPRLLDSIYRGYPVSVLLLWTNDAPVHAVSWLIDGQQRVITLSRTLSGAGIDVVFNPNDDEFQLANAATQRDPKWIHVSDLFDDKQYRQIRRALPAGSKGEKQEAQFDRVRAIRDYEIPAIRMIDHSFDQAVEAFQRVNTLGVKLKTEDIESARVAARHSNFIVDEVRPFVKKLHDQEFSRLNVMHLFRACASVAIPDGRSRTPLHELSRNEVTAAWSRTKHATQEAIAIIRNEFGLANMDILWSGALLVPVIAYCAFTPPQKRDVRGIAGWLMIAALHHRYGKAVETALDQDLRAFRSDDPIGKLLSNVRRRGSFGAVPGDFKGAVNDKGALFGVYAACRHMGLSDLFSGSKIVYQLNVDRHHILPRAQFAESKRASADTVANIAFITGAANRSVGASAPEVYLDKINPKILESQCIPLDKDIWRIDRAEKFWQRRRELLAKAFNECLREMLPRRRGNVK